MKTIQKLLLVLNAMTKELWAHLAMPMQHPILWSALASSGLSDAIRNAGYQFESLHFIGLEGLSPSRNVSPIHNDPIERAHSRFFLLNLVIV